MSKIRSYEELFDLVQDDKLKGKLLSMHSKLESRMKEWPASIKNHHNWEGGYYDHIEEVVSLAVDLWEGLGFKDISIDDVILCAYLHDLEKLEKYEKPESSKEPVTYPQKKFLNSLIDEGKLSDEEVGDIDLLDKFSASRLISKATGDNDPMRFSFKKNEFPIEDTAYIMRKCMEYGILLNRDQLHALAWSHGGWSSLASKRFFGPSNISQLAIIIHSADMLSCGRYGDGRE